MDWVQFAIMVVTFVGLFIWNRSESRSDARHMDQKLESNRNLSLAIHNENQQIINNNKADSDRMLEAIRQDIKDFHGRLAAIEERRLKN